MPYIKDKDREKFKKALSEMWVVEIGTAGELNYLITKLMNQYIAQKGKSYQTCAEVRAACHDAAEEFYRRVVGPYEEKKIDENGDVYSDEILE